MTDPVKIIVGEGDITEVNVPDYNLIQTGGGGGGSGSDGATFFPEVSEEGVISWTNDGGYDNPEPVNIKGPAGNDGNDGNDGEDGTTFTPAVDASGNLSWTNDGGKQNPQTVNIKGPQGDAGEGVPAGGTTGQVLAKSSNADYETEWVDQSGGGGGTSDYNDLSNKPSINGNTLSGNKTAAQLGLGTYSKPSGGIPKSDLASAVQTSLGKADTALQSVPSNYRTATAQDAIDAAQNAAIAGIILESTGDTTDRTAEILSRLTTYKKCILGTGTFYTTGIDMPNDSSLIGCGDASILLKTGNGDYVVKMNQYNTVTNLHINGNDNDMSATPGTHHGILWLGDFSTTETHTLPREGKISNLSIENCNGGGITCNDTGTGRIYNLVACNIAIRNCSVGINIPFLSEYHRFTNVDAWYCYYGCINNGGNNCFVNCDFSDSRVIGFVIDNSNGDKTNNSHGTCVGCSFNHIGNNDGLALSLNGVTAGFTFGNCNIFRGSVEIINCIGVAITDSLFGKSITITVTDSQAIQFANDTFQGAPTLAISGSSYPHFRDCFNYTTGASILNSELVTRTVTITYSASANGTYTANLYTIINNDLPSGYEAAGITGVQTGNNACVPYAFRYLNSNYSLGIRNVTATAVSNVTAIIEYLCKPI